MPKWLTAVDQMKPGGAFVLAIVCTAVNPKNLILAAGAAAGVAQVNDSVGDAVGAATRKGQAVRDDVAESVARGAHEVERYATAAKTDRA